jgi:hypothetical protein
MANSALTSLLTREIVLEKDEDGEIVCRKSFALCPKQKVEK